MPTIGWFSFKFPAEPWMVATPKGKMTPSLAPSQ